jgi:hypothetical protein
MPRHPTIARLIQNATLDDVEVAIDYGAAGDGFTVSALGLSETRWLRIPGNAALEAVDGVLPYPVPSPALQAMLEMANSPVFQRQITDFIFDTSPIFNYLTRGGEFIFNGGDSIQSPLTYPSLGAIPITVDPYMPEDHIAMVNGKPGDRDFSIQVLKVASDGSDGDA